MAMKVFSYVVTLSKILIIVGGQAARTTNLTSTSDVHLTATPGTFLPGLTATLVVNCSLPPNTQMTNILSLILSRTSPDQATKEIASIVPQSADVVQVTDPASLGAKVKGHISGQGHDGGYLTLTWEYPSDDVEGQYQCEAFGADLHGHPKVSRSEVEVVMETDVTPTVLTGEIRTLTSRLTALEKFQTDAESRLSESMDAVFVAQEAFGGHTYKLSRPMLRDISMHDHLCRLFGGYLVELETQAEYNFLEQWAMVRLGAKKVAIGISDRDHEGTFTFIRSGQTAPTHKVGDGYNGRGEDGMDCVELWDGPYHDGYVDEPCYGPNTAHDVANQFVCEFPN